MRRETTKKTDVLEKLFLRVIEKADEEAFSSIYAHTEKLFFRRALSFLRSRSLAETAIQEAYLKMFRYRASFMVGRRFLPWAYTVLDKVVLDIHARHSSVREVPLESIQDPADPREWDPGMHQEIEDALAGLPRRQREAMKLRAEFGYSYREIGACMDCTVSAVAELLYRARSRLRKEMLGARIR